MGMCQDTTWILLGYYLGYYLDTTWKLAGLYSSPLSACVFTCVLCHHQFCFCYRHWDISSHERMDILRQFTTYGLEHWGSDTRVCKGKGRDSPSQ